MRRIVPILQFILVVAIALVGYVAFHPSAPAAAYPTAVGSFDAPTAWSDNCTWPQHCTSSEWVPCVPSEDPLEGCEPIPRYPWCQGCYI